MAIAAPADDLLLSIRSLHVSVLIKSFRDRFCNAVLTEEKLDETAERF
jgi:hypothetical protein